MTCPFHGWVFGLDGKLLSALRQDAFDECDLVTRGLIRVPVGEWGGMVFIKAHAGDERIDVEAFLGEMALPLLGLELEKVFPVASDRLEIVGNWKFALDTYHESYHFDILHKETFQGTGFSGEICAINHYGRHHEFCFKGPQFTPEGMPAKPGDKDVVDTCGRDLVIFPNALINRYPLSLEDDIVSVHRVFPGDTMNKGFSIVSSYRSGSPVTEANREECEKTHQFLLYLLRQDDYRVVENSTANLNYLPSDFKLLLGRNEIIVQAMHRDLAIASGMPLPD